MNEQVYIDRIRVKAGGENETIQHIGGFNRATTSLPVSKLPWQAKRQRSLRRFN